MSKIRYLTGRKQVIYHCPGCKELHAVRIVAEEGKPLWQFNGDMDKPTFSPSVLTTCDWSDAEKGWVKEVCHCFVVNGWIEFLNDCTHMMAGVTVEMPDWPYKPGEFGGIEECP